LDEVFILQTNLEVYPADNEKLSKPPAGQGLNKRAIVEIFKLGCPESLSIQEFTESLEVLIQEQYGGKFLDYDPTYKTLKFEVSEFK
jgi:hypothetical protein